MEALANKPKTVEMQNRAIQRLCVLVIGFAILCPISRIALAEESAKELTVKAQQECDLGRATTERVVRLAHFKRSQAIAEEAIELDEQFPDAHFALFCSIGEQMRIDGERYSGSLITLFRFRRVMRALDRTLELNPDHLDALSSKGTLLIRLPVIFGGNRPKGEEMLRQVIQRDHTAVNARMALAKSYAARGNHHEAVSLAREALKIAETERREDLIPEAQATFLELSSQPGQ